MRTIAAFLLVILTLNGCFAYMPSRGAPLRQGQGVRVLLSSPLDVRLVDVTANNVATLDGEVVSSDSATLVLSARMVRSNTGYEQLGGGATVQIPTTQIGEIEERRLSAVKTAGLVGIIVGLTAIVAAANTGTGVKGGPGGGGGSGQ